VRRIVVDARGEAAGVEYDGPQGRVTQAAGVTVLASYAFENTRLLLLSKSKHFPRGLGNDYGQVGRCYMPRQICSVYGLFEGRRLNRFVGPIAQGMTIDDLNADNFDHDGLGFIRGGRVAAVNENIPIAGSALLPPEVPRWGVPYKKFLADNFNSIAWLNPNPETLPYDANFLDLDPTHVDPTGVPVVRITYDVQDNERRAMRFLQEHASALAHAMGADRVWADAPSRTPFHTHDVGGTRMGSDPAHAVVDGFGRVHGAPRVFVVGGSVFPTQSGLNPTLTMQSLGLRTGVHIAQGSLDGMLEQTASGQG
jgi:gluconate 2-dehydrogenase alpha chain